MRRTDFIHYADTDKPVILINHDIGFDKDFPEVDYIDGDDFVNALLQLDNMGKKTIEVWICSNGGFVTDGMKMYQAILDSKAKVNTKCTGNAASIAAVIFCAGRERIMLDYTNLMFHNPSGGPKDDAMKAIRNSIVKMIAGRCGLSEDKVSSMMEATTWMDADDAKKAGIATKVEDVADKNIKNALNQKFVAQLEYTNHLLNNKKMEFTKEDAKNLGLPEDSSQELIGSVMKAQLTALKNKKNDADGDDDGDMDKKNKETGSLTPVIKKMQEAHDKLCEDHEELQGMHKELAKRVDKLEGDMKNSMEAKNLAETENRKSAISLHIKNAEETKNIKMKAEDVTEFVNMAAKDADGLKFAMKAVDMIAPVAKDHKDEFKNLDEVIVKVKGENGELKDVKRTVVDPLKSKMTEDEATNRANRLAMKNNQRNLKKVA